MKKTKTTTAGAATKHKGHGIALDDAMLKHQADEIKNLKRANAELTAKVKSLEEELAAKTAPVRERHW